MDFAPTESGKSTGSIWFEPVSGLHFGAHYALCCGAKSSCGCGKPAHFSCFDTIVDVTRGCNPTDTCSPDQAETEDREGRTLVLGVNDHESHDEMFFQLVSGGLLDMLHSAIAAKKCVFVHCCHGCQRGPSVVICYLVRFLGKSVDEAKLLVRLQRPCAVGGGKGAKAKKVATFQSSMDRLHAQVAARGAARELPTSLVGAAAAGPSVAVLKTPPEIVDLTEADAESRSPGQRKKARRALAQDGRVPTADEIVDLTVEA